MSAAAVIAVRLAGAAGLLVLNGVVASAVISSSAAHAGMGAGPVTSGPRILRGLKDLLKLLSKEDLTADAIDARALRAAPLLSVCAAVLALYPLAIAEGADLGGGGLGILFTLGALMLAGAGALLAGTAAAPARDTWAIAPEAVSKSSCLAVLALTCVTPVMLAGGTEAGVIVEAQRGTYLFGVLPRWLALSPHFVAFALYLAAASLLVARPVRPAHAGAPESDAASAYSGARFAVMKLADLTISFVLSALGVTLFLGGWLVPYVDRWPLAALLGAPVFLLKTYALMYLLARVRDAMPRGGGTRVATLAWTRLAPAALAWAFAYAAFIQVVRR